MMMVGAGFNALGIEIAAEAVVGGKNPRRAVADMIRDGAV